MKKALTKKRKTKTPNIREGDRIRILNPEFVTRCGYPLDFTTEARRIEDENRGDIIDFLKSQGVDLRRKNWPHDIDERPINKIAKAIAYELIKQKGFGGDSRTLHTRTIAELKGTECKVMGKCFVKTGIRSHGGVDWNGEYEPPYLGDEKTHRILELDIQPYDYNEQLTVMVYSKFGPRLWIDADNVELIGEA